MDVAELIGPGKFEVRNRDRPDLDANQVLVAVSRVGICGSDLHWYKHGQMGDRVVEDSLILGHESAGEIVDIGTNVLGLSVGDRVAIEPGIPCGTCQACRDGDYNLCPDVDFMSTPGTDGALAEYVAWPAEFIHPLPEGMTMTEGALCEPLSVGLQAIRRGEVGVGDTVLIMGAGPIGRTALECATAAGATKIVVVDIVDEKLDQAVDQGADLAINSRTQDVIEVLEAAIPTGVDVAIEATGAPPAIEIVPDTVGRGGTVVLVGLAADQAVPFDTYRLVRNQINIRGSYRFANTYSTAIELIADGAVDVESIVDFHTPLSEVSNAFERATESDIVKGVIDVA
ncbi:NAD(P)-dependent alcohol dehydrogenase [Natrinema sp. SYSU A 869]|uniref:NAD(P)-dependent alcohol dehydrogenase n=1 Tax=Natrinema sp. SYSU A 869 TaxID=2871694 RepID=UPI001CA422ED|nr:NAD(P)-dependent alcohol dehydrogenase [Natrinema sp. SYSU A 869]